jgi:hypothetical protein
VALGPVKQRRSQACQTVGWGHGPSSAVDGNINRARVASGPLINSLVSGFNVGRKYRRPREHVRHVWTLRRAWRPRRAPPTRVDAARVGRKRAMGRTEAGLLPIVDSGPGVATYPAGPAGSNLSRYICAGR